jgi:ubiquinone/menaquinone biosynthesis C-methylase UbiE
MDACLECGKPSVVGLGKSNTKYYCQDHAPNYLVDMNDMMADLSIEEKRVFLQKFYDGAYCNDMYNPHNGYYGWKWIIEQNKFPFDKALDVGCGTGEGIRYALDKGKEVWGIDFADAREAWKKWGVEDRCQIASALNIPYPDESFDLVVCMDVLEHIPEEDVLDVLKEMRRVGNTAYVYAIALTLEKEPVGKKVLTHITVKNADWWIDKFIEAGYGVAQTASGKPALQFDDNHIRAFLTKDC